MIFTTHQYKKIVFVLIAVFFVSVNVTYAFSEPTIGLAQVAQSVKISKSNRSLPLRVYCTFSPLFNQDNKSSVCGNNAFVSLGAGTKKAEIKNVPAANKPNGAQVQNAGNTPPQYPQGGNTIVVSPTRETVRTIVEYRNTGGFGTQGPVGPQGPKGDTGAQGLPGINGSGGGGFSVISSPVLGGSNLQISNSVLSNIAFYGTSTFDRLPTLPLTTGALLVGNASSTAAELLPGANGQVLTVNASGTPVWVSLSAISASTTNQITYATSSNTIVSTVSGITATTSINELNNIILNGTTTAATVSAQSILSNLVRAVTGTFTNLFASLANFGQVFTGNITATGTAQFATTSATALSSNSLQTTDLNTTNATTTNLSVTNLSIPTSINTSGNTITSNVGGSVASGTIINTNALSTTTNSFATVVNGVTSAFTNLINTFAQSLSGNTLTTTINGVTATSSVISNNTVSSAGNIITTNVNGILSTSTAVNSNTLSTSGVVLSSNVNGVLATTSLANAIASSTTNTLSFGGSILTTIVNGLNATTSLNNLNIASGTIASFNATNATTTNLFATSSRFINATGTNLIITGTTGLGGRVRDALGSFGNNNQFLRSNNGTNAVWSTITPYIDVSNGLLNNGANLILGGNLNQNTNIYNSGFGFGIGDSNNFTGGNQFAIGGTNNFNGGTENYAFGRNNTFNNSNDIWQIGYANVDNGNNNQFVAIGGDNTSSDNTNLNLFGNRNNITRTQDSTVLGYRGNYDRITGSVLLGNQNDLTNSSFDNISLLGRDNNFTSGFNLNNGVIVGNTNTLNNNLLNFGLFGNNFNIVNDKNIYALGSNLTLDANDTVFIGTNDSGRMTLDSSGILRINGALSAGGSLGSANQVFMSTGGGLNAWVDALIEGPAQTFSGAKTLTGTTTLATTSISRLITANTLTFASSTGLLTSNIGGSIATTSLASLIATTTNTLSISTTTNNFVLSSIVNGKTATTSTNFVNSNSLATTTNSFSTLVNGVQSLFINIINSFVQSISGNTLTTTINGVTATSSVISSNGVSSSANTVTSSVNGVASSTSIINSNSLSTSGIVLSSTINGVVATTSLSNIVASSTTNTLTSSGNILTSNVNGKLATSSAVTSNTLSTTTNSFATVINGVLSSVANIINSFTQSLSGNTLTTTINGVTATSSVISSNGVSSSANTITSTVNGVASSTSIINSNVLTFATSTGLFSSTINGVLATTTIPELGVTLLGTPSGSNANGGSITGNTLTLSLADGTNPGIVSTGTQTFAGAKTFSGNLLANGNTTIGDATTDRLTINSQILGGNALVFQGATDNAFVTTLAVTDPTANRTITLPDVSGTVALNTTAWMLGGNAPGLASTVLGTTDGTVLNIQSGSANMNIGTEAFAKSISIGNNVGASNLFLTSGTAGQIFTTTAVATNNGFDFIGNSLTTTNLFNITGNAVTTGSGFNLTTTNAGLASTNGFFRVANTGAAAGTSIFARLQPSSTAGSGLTLLNNGNIGIGTLTPGNQLNVASSTAFTSGLRLGINSATAATSTNGKVLTVNSDGDVVLAVDSSQVGVDLAAQKSTALTTPIIGTTIQTVIFNTESIDINNAHVNTTGIYTVPVSDTYEINSSMEFLIQGQNFTGDSSVCVVIQRAGTTLSQSCLGDSDDTPRGPNSSNVNVSATLALTAGQQINIGVYRKGLTGTLTFVTAANTNFLTIKRVGNAVVVSDARLKKDINDYTLGLQDVLGLHTKSYYYNGLSKNAINDGVIHVGILAQDLQNTALGNYAIATNTDGFLKFDKDPLIFASINAIKELNTKIETGFTGYTFSTSTTPELEVDQKITAIIIEIPRVARDYIRSQMILGKKAVRDFVAEKVTALRGYFDEIFTNKTTTKELCVGDVANGGVTCITKAQLDALLQNTGQTSQAPSGVTGATAGGSIGGGATSGDTGASGNGTNTSGETGDTTSTEPTPDVVPQTELTPEPPANEPAPETP